MTPLPAPALLCEWCGTAYDPADLPPYEDFGVSPGYCSTSCETAHGESLERSRRVDEQLERADYQQHHMLDADWREHLSPVGDATRCRACTSVYFHGHPEFCSSDCETDFMDAMSRWADRADRYADTPAHAA